LLYWVSARHKPAVIQLYGSHQSLELAHAKAGGLDSFSVNDFMKLTPPPVGIAVTLHYMHESNTPAVIQLHGSHQTLELAHAKAGGLNTHVVKQRTAFTFCRMPGARAAHHSTGMSNLSNAGCTVHDFTTVVDTA
jgi:hypothetical protein